VAKKQTKGAKKKGTKPQVPKPDGKFLTTEEQAAMLARAFGQGATAMASITTIRLTMDKLPHNLKIVDSLIQDKELARDYMEITEEIFRKMSSDYMGEMDKLRAFVRAAFSGKSFYTMDPSTKPLIGHAISRSWLAVGPDGFLVEEKTVRERILERIEKETK